MWTITALSMPVRGKGFTRAQDAGRTWRATNQRLTDRFVQAITIDPWNSGTLYTCLMQNSFRDIVIPAISKTEKRGLVHGQPWIEQIARKRAFVRTAQSATALYTTFF
jgi:hypothetical protein